MRMMHVHGRVTLGVVAWSGRVLARTMSDKSLATERRFETVVRTSQGAEGIQVVPMDV